MRALLDGAELLPRLVGAVVAMGMLTLYEFSSLPGFPCSQNERLQQNCGSSQVFCTKELSPCCCKTLFPKWTECWRISAFSFLQPFCFSLIVEPMENWLQLMLNWDPQQRGGSSDPETGSAKCFQLMDHILNLKVSEGCNWV